MRVRSGLFATLLIGAALTIPASLSGASTEDAARTPTIPAVADDEADSLYQVAGDLYAEERYREAIPLFLKVVELDPRRANAYALLGGSYFQLGDHDRAIRAFERALQLDEGIKLAYLGLVASNYLTERVEDAREWVRRMVPILTGEERARYLAMLSHEFPDLVSAEL